MLTDRSTKNASRVKSKDIVTVQEELRPGEGRTIPGFSNSVACAESHGDGRRKQYKNLKNGLKLTDSQRDEMASHLDDTLDLSEGSFLNDEKTQKYGNLLFLLQSEPRHIAHLCRLVTMAEIDQLLQTVMFTIYGNQYESREEHLLLTMFQVSHN